LTYCSILLSSFFELSPNVLDDRDLDLSKTIDSTLGAPFSSYSRFYVFNGF